MPSEPSSPGKCNRCGHLHLPNTHTCGYATAEESTCECRAARPIINDRCKCSHDRFRHNYDTVDGPCSKPDCDCKAYAPVTVETVELPEPDETPVEAYAEAVSEAVARMRAEADVKPFKPYCRCCDEAHEPYMGCMQPMPQPERRPPLTVQYSVAGGHPYEVSIPGDASVTAEDGVLIIKHPSAQILAITRVAPMED